MRYEMRLLDTGWTVWDMQTNTPVTVSGRWQTGLAIDGAEFLLHRLNEQKQDGLKPGM